MKELSVTKEGLMASSSNGASFAPVKAMEHWVTKGTDEVYVDLRTESSPKVTVKLRC